MWVDDKRAPAVQQAADRFAAESRIPVVTDVVAKDQQTNFVTAAQAGKGIAMAGPSSANRRSS